MHMHTEYTTSVDRNQQGKEMSKMRGCNADVGRKTQKRLLRFLLSYGAMRPPVIYLLSECVGPFAQHSSAGPPQHMKAPATAVLDGGK